VRRISWYAYVYHRPSMHVLANGGPAQGHCVASNNRAQPRRGVRGWASGVPIMARILDGKINIDRPEGVGRGGQE